MGAQRFGEPLEGLLVAIDPHKLDLQAHELDGPNSGRRIAAAFEWPRGALAAAMAMRAGRLFGSKRGCGTGPSRNAKEVSEGFARGTLRRTPRRDRMGRAGLGAEWRERERAEYCGVEGVLV